MIGSWSRAGWVRQGAVLAVLSFVACEGCSRDAPSEPLGAAIDLGGVTIRPPTGWTVEKRERMGYWVANSPGGAGMSFTAYRRSESTTLEQVRDEQVESLRAVGSFMSDAGVRAQRSGIFGGYPGLVCDLAPVGRHIYLRLEKHFVVITCKGADDLCEKVAASVQLPRDARADAQPNRLLVR